MKRVLCCLLSLVLLLSLAGLPVVAAGTVTQPVVVGVRASMGEDFTVRFYIRVPEGGENVRAMVGGVTYSAVPAEEEGLYVVTYPHLTLLSMTEEIEVIPSCRKDNQVVKGVSYFFSMRDYAMRLLADAEQGSPLYRVLVAMLNYGAAAQVYNSYRPGNLANDYLPAAAKQPVVRDYQSVLRKEGEATQSEAELVSTSMVIGEAACFKLYVNVAGQEKLRVNGGSGYPEWQMLNKNAEAAMLVEDIFVEVADNPDFEDPTAFPLEKVAPFEGYLAVTSGIYAAEFGRPYYIRAVTPAGHSATLVYSVESYVARNVSDTGLDEGAKQMVYAMMEYGDAVQAYRQSLDE